MVGGKAYIKICLRQIVVEIINTKSSTWRWTDHNSILWYNGLHRRSSQAGFGGVSVEANITRSAVVGLSSWKAINGMLDYLY